MTLLLLFACAPSLSPLPAEPEAAGERVASTVGVAIDARSDRTRLQSRRGGAVDVRLLDAAPGVVSDVGCVPGLAECRAGVVVEHPAGPDGAGALTEWWAEVGASVEQGWIVPERPAAGGALRFGLGLDGADDLTLLPGGAGATFRDATGVPWVVGGLAATDATGRSVPVRFELDEALTVVVDAADATFPVSVDPIYTAAVAVLTDPQSDTSSHFGYALASGDFDGDGHADLAVGAYGGGVYSPGRVSVYPGGAGGTALTPTVTLNGPDENAWGGYAVAAGDLDGDGYDDLAVGSPAFSTGRGRVEVYLGSATGLATRPVASLTGASGTEALGYRLWIVPDLDADGDDELVLVRSHSGAAPQVEWYAGGPGGVGSSPTAVWTGSVATFGTDVVSADLDGDGHPELVISKSNGNGTVNVYGGSASGPSATPSLARTSTRANDRFGSFLGSPGDVNRDGRDDLVVVAGGRVGRTELWLGSSTYLGSAAAVTISGTRVPAGGAGDLNWDGRADFVGADSATGNGSAYVYVGRAGVTPLALSATITDPLGGTSFGRATEIAGDIDGDGYDDLVVSGGESSHAEAVYVFLGGPTSANDADGDGWSTATDCDDANAAVHPGAVETCNGYDDDCDGLVDQRDDDAEGLYQVWRDGDHDGVGATGSARAACSVLVGWTTSTGDCNDADASVYPGAPDPAGDGIDQDCDGDPDCCEDLDGDGFGGGDDCDDADPAVFPGAEERCNGVDDDCDGLVDSTDPDLVDGATYGRDADRDGYGSDTDTRTSCSRPAGYVATLGDCNDAAGGTHPGATDVCGDGIDQDCESGDARCDVPTYNPADAGGALTSADGGSLGVRFVFDATGDGLDDLLVRAATDDAWMAVPGPFTGTVDTSTAAARYEREGRGSSSDTIELYGPAGDLDGDGVEELVFYYNPYGGPDGSGLYFMNRALGTLTVSPALASTIITGVTALDATGDFNGDGIPDVVGGGYHFDDADGDSVSFAGGWAGPMEGSYSYADATFLVTSSHGEPWGGGGKPTLLDDLDGDGVDEVLCGAYPSDVVYVFSGPFTGGIDVTDADAQLFGLSGSDAGENITTIDENGDGTPDLAVAGNDNRGRVWVVDGPLPTGASQLETVAVATIRGAWDDEAVGVDLDSVDLDVDGAGDFIIGMNEGSVAAPHTAAIVVLWGPVRGLGAPEDFEGLRIERPADDWVGVSNAVSGDFDADGLPDLAVSVEGQSLFFFGSQGLW